MELKKEKRLGIPTEEKKKMRWRIRLRELMLKGLGSST